MTDRQTHQADQTDDIPRQKTHPLSGIRGRMAGAILGLGLGAGACEPTQTTTEQSEIEYRDDERVLQDAKEGLLTLEQLQVEIDLQLSDGNISEFYAEKLLELAKGMGATNELKRTYQTVPPENSNYEKHTENPTKYKAILRLLKDNQGVVEEMKRQERDGLLDDKANSIKKDTLLNERKINDFTNMYTVFFDWISERERKLDKAQHYLKKNAERKVLVDRLEKRSIIDEKAVKNLMKEDPYEAVWEISASERDRWKSEGFIDDGTSKILTRHLDYFGRFAALEERFVQAKSPEDESKIKEIEHEKRELIKELKQHHTSDLRKVVQSYEENKSKTNGKRKIPERFKEILDEGDLVPVKDINGNDIILDYGVKKGK